MKTILLIALLLTGCVGSGQYFARSLHDIKRETVKDIEGDYVRSSNLIYKKTGFLGQEFLEIMSAERPTGTFYYFKLTYDGQGWMFYEQIRFKADGEVYTVIDDDPIRDVISDSRVVETLLLFLNEEQVNSLRNTESLTVQWGADPIELPKETVIQVKSFVNEGSL